MSFDSMLVTHVVQGVPVTMSLGQKNEMIRNQEVPEPIRLVMIKTVDNCQFCSNPQGKSYISYISFPCHMGFISCPSCHSKMEETKFNWIRDFGYGNAKHLAGRDIKIRRSSGQIEDDWELNPDDYMVFYDDDGTEIVSCKKKGVDVIKSVRVSELFELNPI